MHIVVLLLLLIPPLLLLLYGNYRRSAIPLLHPLSATTSFPILLATLRGRRNAAIHAAHLRHGPIVRLSPSEISIASPDDLKTVYTSFPKPRWYSIFRNYGAAPMFALLGGREHAERKKMLAKVYSNSAVSRSGVLQQVAAETLPVLLRSFEVLPQPPPPRQGVEVWRRFNALTMDLVTAFLFTRGVGSRFSNEEGEEAQMLKLYHCRRDYFALSSEMPRVARWVVPRWVADANDKIEAWCADLCALRTRQRDGDNDDAHGCVLDHLLAAGLPRTEAASEMLDHIGAGHETTALALSFTLAAMSQRPELQRRLRDAVLPLARTESGWMLPRLDEPGYKALESLPLLNAIIKESLRLYAPIPGSQPRVVPRDTHILGHAVAAGTRVSAQAWTLHADPAVWGADVDRFLPERWERGRGVERAWWPFGSGARGCVGRWVAMWELRVVLAAVYANFETGCDEPAVPGDAYTTAPVKGKVEIFFRRV